MPDKKRKPDHVHYSEIYAPFQRSPIQDVRLGYNGKCVADSIYYILHTRKGERVMLPEFGSNIQEILFEPIDMHTALDLEMEIKDAIERWEPRAIIDAVIIIPLYDRNAYDCSIRFHIRNLEGDLQEMRLQFYNSYY